MDRKGAIAGVCLLATYRIAERVYLKYGLKTDQAVAGQGSAQCGRGKKFQKPDIAVFRCQRVPAEVKILAAKNPPELGIKFG